MFLELGGQLEDLLVLLILCLVVVSKLSFGLIDAFTDETAFILSASYVLSVSLDLHVLLVEACLGIHNVAICLVSLRGKIGVLALQVFKLTLKNL